MSEERCPPPKFAALEIDEGIVSMYSCVSSDTCALGGGSVCQKVGRSKDAMKTYLNVDWPLSIS